jgi:hypothetical protein
LASANNVQQSLILPESPNSSPLALILETTTGMVIVDIEKAYDADWLAGLLFKLISLHLPDYLLFFLKFYLEGRTFTVHLNDTTSTPKPTRSGLLQGAVLSTTLFSVYLSEIPHLPHPTSPYTQMTLPSLSVLAA